MSRIFCVYRGFGIILSAVVKNKLHVVHEGIEGLVLVHVNLLLNGFEI